jgi:hypothetical protein
MFCLEIFVRTNILGDGKTIDQLEGVRTEGGGRVYVV